MPGKIPSEFTEAQRRRFIEIRRRGRAAYVLYFGIVRFGGFWALMMGVLWYALMPGYYPPFVPHGLPRLVALMLYWLPFGVLGGFIYGRWMWRRFERNKIGRAHV